MMLDFDLEEWYSIMLRSQHMMHDYKIQWNLSTTWFAMPVYMLHCNKEGGFVLIREVPNQGLNENMEMFREPAEWGILSIFS